jgi:hypothetical protein
MLLLTNVRRNGTVDLLIVLGDDSIERIKQYDHAEVPWFTLPSEYSTRRPHIIGVGYATADEMVQIQNLASEGKKAEAFALVTRGFKCQPEKGDHDFGPTVLGQPTPGTKH